MAREDLEQNMYLVGSLKRYVSSARNFVEEAQHRKLYEDLPEYGTLTLETNEAVKALSDCLHNIREKEQAIVRASADMMKQEGIPTDVYHSDDLTYASETTTHVRSILENQNRASVLRGREEVENMN